MANAQHLKTLKKGVTFWNSWRLGGTGHEIVEDADLSHANLRGTDLSHSEFAGADMRGADLTKANLSEADLSNAELNNAALMHCNLAYAFLSYADLTNANLSEADLTHTNLSGATLSKCNLTDSVFGGSYLPDVDLSETMGLNTAKHLGPSSIGIDTIYKSKGEIPDKFLREAGVPEEIIDIVRSIRSGPPIQWHSCFISYSMKDDEFARRLHSRMRQANMRVWFAPEDVKGGEKLHEQLFRAIQLHDKLLLVLSPASIQSAWVMTEIRKAREIEKKEKPRKLFPIRLVDFETLRSWTCFDADSGKDLAVEVREYFIPDFSNWKDQDAFEDSFKRLQQDLKADLPPSPA